MNRPTVSELSRAPKVLLHDHLDGGLRPSTIAELADRCGYRGLPTRDPEALALHIQQGAQRRSLELYLDMFRYTFGVMQTDRALYRVAAECAQDLADDRVVYAEVRFAPELHLEGGLRPDEVVRAVVAGFRDGSEGRNIRIGILVTAMRTLPYFEHSHRSGALDRRTPDQPTVGPRLPGPHPQHGQPSDERDLPHGRVRPLLQCIRMVMGRRAPVDHQRHGQCLPTCRRAQ